MKEEQRALLRALPAVDALLRRAPLAGAAVTTEVATVIAREVAAALRHGVTAGQIGDADALARAEAAALHQVDELLGRPRLRPVWNGTGVLIHTNAGRAPLSAAALAAITATAAGYSNLELDLDRGERGSRQDLLRPLLRWLGRAEDALVVNNGAAALMLALHALAPGRTVLVSRGELVEIG
ncbi:MAG: L-seryl-tRNA(Sec) selenium transferase, partial [Deltaproteobacteria bacterium]|nr:L-seryl-tRNA(Sec) selenium transferase [Deltaproteobacteria bacterium]